MIASIHENFKAESRETYTWADHADLLVRLWDCAEEERIADRRHPANDVEPVEEKPTRRVTREPYVTLAERITGRRRATESNRSRATDDSRLSSRLNALASSPPTPASLAHCVPAAHKKSWRDFNAEILDRLDIMAECRRLGLRVAEQSPNSEGWISCHAIGRPDRNPSASLNGKSGWYVDFATGEKLGPWDLLAMLGGHANWEAARDHYAEQLGVPKPIGKSGREKLNTEQTGFSDDDPKTTGCQLCGGDETSCTCQPGAHDDNPQLTCGFGVWLVHKTTGQLSHAKLPCDCWRCDWCSRNRLKPRWKKHVRRLWDSDTWDSGQPRHIWRKRITAAQWQATRKRLNRNCCDYLAIKDGRHLVIYASNGIGKNDECMRPSEAVRRCHRDIDACWETNRPISASRFRGTYRMRNSDAACFEDEASLPIASREDADALSLQWEVLVTVYADGWNRPNQSSREYERADAGGRFDPTAVREVSARRKLRVTQHERPAASVGPLEWMSLTGADDWDYEKTYTFIHDVRQASDERFGMRVPFALKEDAPLSNKADIAPPKPQQLSLQ